MSVSCVGWTWERRALIVLEVLKMLFGKRRSTAETVLCHGDMTLLERGATHPRPSNITFCVPRSKIMVYTACEDGDGRGVTRQPTMRKRLLPQLVKGSLYSTPTAWSIPSASMPLPKSGNMSSPTSITCFGMLGRLIGGLSSGISRIGQP